MPPEPPKSTSNAEIAGSLLAPYQQRVITERDELCGKLSKLNQFLKGETFKALSEAERARLTRQSFYMGLYAKVLDERIAAF